MSELKPKTSAAYYLLPILLGVLGGIIGYFALRNKDGKKARNCLIVGVGITAVGTAGLLAMEAAPDPRVDVSVARLNEAISFVQDSLDECRQADRPATLHADIFTKFTKLNEIKALIDDIGYAGLMNHERIKPLALELVDLSRAYQQCITVKEAEFSS